MGADEKHAATYHGGEYTPTKYMPTTDDVRDVWVDRKVYHLPNSSAIALVPTVQAEFNRWLETVRAEAKAEALNKAADNIHEIDGREDAMASRWLRACANQYKEEPANGR